MLTNILKWLSSGIITLVLPVLLWNLWLLDYIDKNGKEVIAFRFNYAISFTDGVGKVLLKDDWYSIDREGTLVKF